MKTLLVLAATASLSAATLAADIPPTAYDLLEDFTPPELVNDTWQPLSGSWSASDGTYDSKQAVPTALTIVHSLPPSQEPYAVHARIFNQSGQPGAFAGIVLQFDDPLNYYEVVLEQVDAFHFARIRQVSNGVATTIASGGEAGSAVRTWIDLEVVRFQGRTRIWIDGIPQAFFDGALPSSGRIGLVTHDTTARFDNVVVSRPFGDQPFNTTFGIGGASAWSPDSGNWSVVIGAYHNAATGPTDMSHAPITTAGAGQLDYTLRAQMINPASGPNNLMGIFFAHSAPGDYYELVFSPTGVAAINRVTAGVSHPVATAAYGGQPNVLFDAELFVRAAGDGSVDVAVNGTPIFDHVALAPQNPASLANRAGVITHSTAGTFDNFAFTYGRFTPLLERFNGPLPDESVRSGTWDTVGGTLNVTSVEATDIVTLKCCEKSNFVVRARLRNEFTHSGNLIGLVFGYQPTGNLGAGDYYEVVFSPTGEVQLNKVIQGTKYRLRTTTHTVPPHQWFTVSLVRVGQTATVRVNDVAVIENGFPVFTDQLGAGAIGVVSHWSQAHFDNISIQERIDRRAPILVGIRF